MIQDRSESSAFRSRARPPARLLPEPGAWKARETYDLLSADTFTETFEIAQGDKPYVVYSRNRFTRRKP